MHLQCENGMQLLGLAGGTVKSVETRNQTRA